MEEFGPVKIPHRRIAFGIFFSMGSATRIPKRGFT
jgi:hypothetical protein